MADIQRVTHAQNIRYDRKAEALYIIDQTLLPNEEKEIRLQTAEEMYEAIRSLKVRGAPAIGICVGYCMNVEALLTARIGDAGKRLHTARSRNDQVALDFRMYVRREIPAILAQLLEFQTVLAEQAGKYQTTVMDVVQQILCGKVNKDLVSLAERLGGQAIGLCGLDGGLFEAELLDKKYGLVGKITSVNPKPVEDSLSAGYIPIVSTVAQGTDADTAYNINADTAAAKLAEALQAEKLILLTDVRGLLRDPHEGRRLRLVDSPGGAGRRTVRRDPH